MATIKRVLIVGGGIGGLTLAVALKRQGIEADIVEINPAWSVYGVGIIQPSNALRALRSVGLGEACLARGWGFQGWRFCDKDGNVVAEVPSENVAGAGYPPTNGISRSTLHKILCDATLDQGTRVSLGITLSSWSEAAEGIDVSFTDGSSGRYDLVVGADGAYSKLRAMLFGDSLKPTFTGQSVWRHNFRRPKDLDWGMLFYGSKSKGGLVPLAEDLMYLLLVTAEPGNPRMPADGLHELLRARLGEYGGIVAQLRDEIVDPTQVVYRPLEALMLPEAWHRGRVILIGDAAHAGTPHLAEGAAMAIEDSVLLAEMLNGSIDIEKTLTAFTARRLPRVKLVHEVGLQLGEWEMFEFDNGSPAPGSDADGLFARAYAELMQSI
ncbi:FAD-dependent oxidoreductase [Paraburkholderia sp.]|uniref:FAD-dependent oxidoreductase n=1 Tax=Paraburkholderia sp. TaxID=1926495 RepID=UPI003C7D67A8